METEGSFLEVYLHPGEFYWGDADTRIKTILGSCIAICMWHPLLKIGGMSHSLLPSRLKNDREFPAPHARYVDEAMQLFLSEIRNSNTKPSEYKVKIFGGAKVIAGILPELAIGSRNHATSRRVLEENGFTGFSEHAGGNSARNIMLDIWSGETWLRRIS